MAKIISRVYDALRVLIGEEEVDVPDASTVPDLPTVAGQLAALTTVVDELIIANLSNALTGDIDFGSL